MNNELLVHCEHHAKSGRITLVVDELYDEIKSRLSNSSDPDIDIKNLIISVYNPTANYTLEGFIATLVDLLNYPGIKAKRPQ